LSKDSFPRSNPLKLVDQNYIKKYQLFSNGCNFSVSNFCPNYNQFNGYIYKTEIEESKCGKTQTQCWYVYTYASNKPNYNVSTSTCEYTVCETYQKSVANDCAQKYYVGKHIQLYKRISDDECLTGHEITNLWYTGIVFLSCGGLCLVLFVIGLISFKLEYINIEITG
jgi:hypothetical protein